MLALAGPRRQRLERLVPLHMQETAVVVHWHLPDSIADMTPAQLRALTGGMMDATVTKEEDAEDAGPAVYTLEDVALHGAKDDAWIAIGDGVYDVTEFMPLHPGGVGMLQMIAGKDATQHFAEMHRPEILTSIGGSYRIGTLEGGVPTEAQAVATVTVEIPAEAGVGAEAEADAGESMYTLEDVSAHATRDECWIGSSTFNSYIMLFVDVFH